MGCLGACFILTSYQGSMEMQVGERLCGNGYETNALWALEKSLFWEFNRTRQLLRTGCSDSPGTFSDEVFSSPRLRLVKAPRSAHGYSGRSTGSVF